MLKRMCRKCHAHKVLSAMHTRYWVSSGAALIVIDYYHCYYYYYYYYYYWKWRETGSLPYSPWSRNK